MTFNDPVLLAVGLLVAAALAWAALAAGRRRRAALASAGIAPAGAVPGPAGGRRLRWLNGVWLSVAGVAVLAFAAAGPSVTAGVSRASGTVILAMDSSGSMGAADVAPTRLAAAKKAAAAFIAAQPPSVDIGVVAFEQGGLEAAVPTADHATTLAAVARLAPSGGTSLGAAILAALSAITRRQVSLGPNGSAPHIGFWPSATIVLLSDGGDGGSGNTGLSGQTAAAATVAQQAGVHVDTVGVGTAAGTTVDVAGYHLFTGLDASALRAISRQTGGSYHPASTAGQLSGIASSIDLRLTVTSQPLPLAGACTAFALLLLAAGAVLTVVRTGRVI